MTSLELFSRLSEHDPSWQNALILTQKHIQVATPTVRLIKNCWSGPLEPREFLRLLGFCRLNLRSLIDAAGLLRELNNAKAETIEQALHTLGIRYAAAVLAINAACTSVLRAKPAPLWRSLFSEMMTRIEIGYRLGAKAGSLGIEGGVLMGFASQISLAIMLVNNPKSLRAWHHSQKSSFPKDDFGCEPYQVAAFVIQQYGFGHEVAIGTALGLGDVKASVEDYGKRVLVWKAAIQWIEALREGRDYPASIEMRNFFPEISPPPRERNSGNPILEALYAEVARVRAEGSKWTWHLPKSSYEESAKAFEAE